MGIFSKKDKTPTTMLSSQPLITSSQPLITSPQEQQQTSTYNMPQQQLPQTSMFTPQQQQYVPQQQSMFTPQQQQFVPQQQQYVPQQQTPMYIPQQQQQFVPQQQIPSQMYIPQQQQTPMYIPQQQQQYIPQTMYNPNLVPRQDPSQECPSNEEFEHEVENDPQINQIIEEVVQRIPPNACGVRPPQHRREERVIESNCPPRIANIRRRLPSPPPDVIERRTVIRAPQDTVNIIIEKPGMPPPCVYEDTDYEPVSPPRVQHSVICVQPSNQCPQGSYPDQQSNLFPGPYNQQSLINPSLVNPMGNQQQIPFGVPQTQQFVPRTNWQPISQSYLPLNQQQLSGGTSMFQPQSSIFSRKQNMSQTYLPQQMQQQQYMPQSSMSMQQQLYPNISQQFVPYYQTMYPSSSQYLRNSYMQQQPTMMSSRLMSQQTPSYLGQQNMSFKKSFIPVQQQQQNSQYTQMSSQMSPVQSPVPQQQTSGNYNWPKTQKSPTSTTSII